MTIIDGKKTAADLRLSLKKEVDNLKKKFNRIPGLTVILIGEYAPSKIYVRNKEKSALEIGLKSEIIKYPDTVDENGEYFPHVPLFSGKKIFNEDGSDADANVAVIIELKKHETLAGKGSLRHSYPHSWRSKAPVIFRNTPQWFISMEKNQLREKALNEIEKVKWYPKQGKNRIYSMIEERPDWVVSRQRAWGVPLSIFYNIKTGKPLVDKEINEKKY